MQTQQLTSVEQRTLADELFAKTGARVTELPSVEWVVESALTRALTVMRIEPAAPEILSPIDCQLAIQHESLMQRVHDRGLATRFLGYAPMFRGHPKIFRGQRSDWAMMNLTDDPTFVDGRMIVPRVVARDIRKTLKAGIDFDAIYVAHEIPTNSVQLGQKVPLDLIMPPPPQRLLRRIAWIERIVAGWWSGIWSTTRGVLAGAAMGVAVATFPLSVAFASADPILFGVNFASDYIYGSDPIGMWYYLTHWDWSQQRG